MISFTELLQQGSAHAWLFIPSAILLGALHGLEPGHSKTMMAAFIVAVRGSVGQAALLGLAAAFSHTLVVWGVALVGLNLADRFDAATSEPYFQLASGVAVLGIAAWMGWRIARDRRHDRDHHHHHHHDDEHHRDDEHHHRLDAIEGEDAHARAHAAEIRNRFQGKQVTTGQILAFGLTGGLIPCPAAITVLLICLQLRELSLGATLVASFSVGLALVLMGVGVAAALGLRHAQKRWSGALDVLAGRAPYLSAALIALVGLYMTWHGWSGLPAA